jgi:outer membrane protein assembly factor BamA
MASLNKIGFMGKLIIMVCALALSAAGQDRPPLDKKVRDIVIIGNEVTQEHVIMRELLFNEGDTLTWELLDESRRRLLNLFLFNQVEMQVYPQDYDDLLLIIDVTEQIYFYPVPILTIRERDWTKWSYGLSLVHSNFRGNNQRLWAGFWLGFRPGYGVSFSDPWIADSLHLAGGIKYNKSTFNHRTLLFEERHHLVEGSLGKWWGLYFRTDIALSMNHINVDEEARKYMQSGETSEVNWGIQLSLRYDTRDLFAYPSSGIMSYVTVFRNGIFQDFNQYFRYDLDIRFYQKLGPFVSALRVYQSYLDGNVPVYRYNYIGFNERIRGHFYTAKEGLNINIGSLELRFPIVPIRYFSLSVPPVPDSYLRNLKIGLSAGIFADTGIIWRQPTEYSIGNFDTGFGAGIHIHLPYVEVFRIDYAFNLELKGQLIAEVGVAF